MPQQLFQKENTTHQGKEISPELQSKLFIFLYYTAKNTLRSNKFVWTFLSVQVFFCLFYIANSVLYSILPSKISGSFLFYIIISDLFLKYYIPGHFVEYILPLIRISLSNRLASVYIIFNILLYYTNIAVLSSVFFGATIEPIIFLLTSFTLNHMVVLLFKTNLIYLEQRETAYLILAMTILNTASILLLPNLGVSVGILTFALFSTNRFVKNNFYADI